MSNARACVVIDILGKITLATTYSHVCHFLVESIIVKHNQNYMMHCTDHPGHDRSNTIWMKDNSVISVNRTLVYTDTGVNQYTLDGNMNLYIYNMTSTHLGNYICFMNGEKVYSVRLRFLGKKSF